MLFFRARSREDGSSEQEIGYIKLGSKATTNFAAEVTKVTVVDRNAFFYNSFCVDWVFERRFTGTSTHYRPSWYQNKVRTGCYFCYLSFQRLIISSDISLVPRSAYSVTSSNLVRRVDSVGGAADQPALDRSEIAVVPTRIVEDVLAPVTLVINSFINGRGVGIAVIGPKG